MLLANEKLQPSTETASDPMIALRAKRNGYEESVDRRLNEAVEAEERAGEAERLNE